MDYIFKDDHTVWNKSTLAHALDNRAVSRGEPSSSNLPEKTNLFDFIKDIAGKNLCLLHLKNIRKDLTAFIPWLRWLVPEGTAVLIAKDEEPLGDYFLKSCMTEEVGVFDAVSVSESFGKEKIGEKNS